MQRRELFCGNLDERVDTDFVRESLIGALPAAGLSCNGGSIGQIRHVRHID